MYLNIKTQEAQSNLADYCRTGVTRPIPGVDTERIKHYRRLVSNIINDSLQSAYPLTYRLLKDDSWDELVDDFFSYHPCQSPQVWWMPREFYEYLVEQDHSIFKQYPSLPNLLEMEWLEVELFMMENIPLSLENDPRNKPGKLVLNPEHRLVLFNYPVHLKKAADIDHSDIGHYFLIMHREPETGKVLFMDISVFFAKLIENLEQVSMSQEELIHQTAFDFGISIDDQAYNASKSFIHNAINNKLILSITN